MEDAIFIAKLAAVIYLCVGLGALMNPKHFQKVLEDFMKNPGLDYLGALVALLFGFLMVGAYNVWAWNWTILVTLLGWGALLKGAVHLLFPTFTTKMMERCMKMNFLKIIPVVAIVLGLIFGYFGFLAV